jgi:hypothetical protein
MKRGEKASLDGVRDKIRRAKTHRDKLQEIINSISKRYPYPFKGEVRNKGRDHLYRWQNPPVLNPDAELILGDCIHNLRSALDHLAYQLIMLNKKTPSRSSAFPILDRPPRARRKFRRREIPLVVPGVSAKASKIIQDVQPYKGGDIGRQLVDLRNLDNIDKHRHLLITVQAVDALTTTWWGDDPPYGTPNSVFIFKAPVHDEVAVRVRWAQPRPDLDPYLNFTVGVRFGERLGGRFARRPVDGVLSTLISTVEEDIVNTLFAPLFP